MGTPKIQRGSEELETCVATTFRSSERRCQWPASSGPRHRITFTRSRLRTTTLSHSSSRGAGEVCPRVHPRRGGVPYPLEQTPEHRAARVPRQALSVPILGPAGESRTSNCAGPTGSVRSSSKSIPTRPSPSRSSSTRVRDRADRHLIPGQHSGQCVGRYWQEPAGHSSGACSSGSAPSSSG